MTKSEASKLAVGDTVITRNGIYEQRGIVIAIEPHHRDGYWVTFQWLSNRGIKRGKKRNQSVYLPNV